MSNDILRSMLEELRRIRDLMEGHTERLRNIDAKLDEDRKLIAERAKAHDEATRLLTDAVHRVAEVLKAEESEGE